MRGGIQHRDRTAHRRAYLDTYARSRSGSVEQTEQQASPSPAVQQAPTTPLAPLVVQATQTVQPKVIAVPTQQAPVAAVTEDYFMPQPAVARVSYSPAPVQQAQPIQPQSQQLIDQVMPANAQRNYLDTLTHRHVQAVVAAPAAEETVLPPMLNTETQSLLEDPVHNERMEANLSALYSGSLTSLISADAKSASAAHVRTIVASAFACGIMAVGMFTFMGNYNAQPVVAQPIGAPVIEVEASAATPKEAPATAAAPTSSVAVNPDQPVRVVISSIGVNAPVEGLGTTPEGLIAVPKAYGMVGWYNKGVLPGKPGPAVLVGHYAGGNRAVFDNLKDLKDGDLITTTNGRGQSFTYRVTAKNEYEKDKVPMAQIFKKSSESRLEIITCSGKWQSNTYDKRLVITAELVK